MLRITQYSTHAPQKEYTQTAFFSTNIFNMWTISLGIVYINYKSYFNLNILMQINIALSKLLLDRYTLYK